MRKTMMPSNIPECALGKHFDDVTIIIKTFERENCLRVSLDSLRVYYPFLPVIIIDDSRNSLDPDSFDEHTSYVHTEYNIGLSEGRNRAVNLVQTKYIFVMDDDFVFTPSSRLDLLLHAVKHTGFAIAGGRMINFGRDEQIFHGAFQEVGSELLIQKELRTGTHEGYPTYDICHNIFLSKTQFLKDNPWDPKLKLREHWDFFYRIKKKGAGLITMRHDVSFDHYPYRPTAYQSMRSDSATGEYVKLALEKHGFTSFSAISAERETLQTNYLRRRKLFERLFKINNAKK